MSQFAELFVSARSRVSLESVYAAPQVSDDLGIARRFLKQQGVLIEGLENLLRTLEEDTPEFVGAIVGKDAHGYASTLQYAVPLSWWIMRNWSVRPNKLSA